MDIVIILLLIVLNGLFAMAEIALISARKSSLQSDAKRGSSSAKTALKLANEPDKFLSTIQIGITLIGILTGIYSGAALADDFGKVLAGWGVSPSYARIVAQAIIVLLVTYLTLIFGELVPKRIGMSVAEKAAKLVAGPMKILAAIASPFVWILAKSTAAAFNMLGIKPSDSKITEEEIKSMIQEGTEGGEVQEVEQDIVERVFALGDRKVDSIMTNRNDIVWIDINMTNEQINETVKSNLYEVYPVAEGNLDSIKGVVFLKDLFGKLEDKEFSLSQVIHPVQYFHDNMDVYKVLEEMKTNQTGYGLIYDEFGNCEGIVTLKDILEGLVGTIPDSHEEPEIIERDDKSGWLVDGQCPFYDFLAYFEREELYSDNDFTTVSGLILEHLEHIPRTGEKLHWNIFTFEIVDMDGARIDKVLVTRTDTTTP